MTISHISHYGILGMRWGHKKNKLKDEATKRTNIHAFFNSPNVEHVIGENYSDFITNEKPSDTAKRKKFKEIMSNNKLKYSTLVDYHTKFNIVLNNYNEANTFDYTDPLDIRNPLRNYYR